MGAHVWRGSSDERRCLRDVEEVAEVDEVEEVVEVVDVVEVGERASNESRIQLIQYKDPNNSGKRNSVRLRTRYKLD